MRLSEFGKSKHIDTQTQTYTKQIHPFFGCHNCSFYTNTNLYGFASLDSQTVINQTTIKFACKFQRFHGYKCKNRRKQNEMSDNSLSACLATFLTLLSVNSLCSCVCQKTYSLQFFHSLSVTFLSVRSQTLPDGAAFCHLDDGWSPEVTQEGHAWAWFCMRGCNWVEVLFFPQTHRNTFLY